MSAPVIITRRSFLTALGLSSAGLCLGVYAQNLPTHELSGKSGAKADPASQAEQNDTISLNPNVFIFIASTGIVSLVCHRSEMGQGIRSSLPVLMADELGADMKKVKVIQAEGDKKYGDQNTDGSASIRKIYTAMREAAATARMMLISAAAEKWKVSPDKLYTEKSFVIQRGTKKKLSFGELAVAASKLPVPANKDIKLRPEKELKNVGTNLPLLDGPAYVTGTALFGADVKLPDMVIAVIARPPVLGGKVSSFDAKPAMAIKGVQKVIEIPHPTLPLMFQPMGGVAVVAENTWAALQGRDALVIKWDHGKNASYNTADFRKTLTASAKKGGKVLRKKGNFDKALSSAEKVIEAEYYVPHLPHQSMEPPVALANYTSEKGGFCEVWAPTQNPQAARTEVARMLGLGEDKVRINVIFLGGGFGRKSKPDYCAEAAYLSKQLKKPVRVQFNREDDMRNDYLNTVNAQMLTAGLDKSGNIVAWRTKTAFPSITYLFDAKTDHPTPSDFQQGLFDLALNVPNLEFHACEADTHTRIGWLRSVYNIFHAFATNSFLDEIAHARKADPLEVMMNAYSDQKMGLEDLGVSEQKNYGQPLSEHPVDGARLRNVLESVAKLSKWKNRKENKGRGFGIAAHRSFNSYVGVVASVLKDKNGGIKVDEMWVSVDAGKIVNADRVRAQMEGALINSMSYLFFGGVTHTNGAVDQTNFDETQIIAMNQSPRKIHVEIIRSMENPGGVGEPGVPPATPAIANAIFDLTGKRLREFASPELKTV